MALAELHAAIRADPADDELRLVYADALAAAGDVAQSDFIHAQLAIARGNASPELRELAATLEAAHGKRFAGALAEHASAWTFERGLVASIDANLAALARHADAILGAAPIQAIELVGPTQDEQAAALLARCPHLARLRLVDALRGGFGPGEQFADFIASPHLGNLAELRLDSDAGEAAARAIATATLPALTAVAFHSFSGNPLEVDDDGAIALAGSQRCPYLEQLVLSGAGIGAAGIAALAQGLRAIRHLVLGPVWYANNPIGADGARALAAGNLPQLASLHLGGCEIGDDGLAALVSAPWFAGVVELDLSDNAITGRGLRALANARTSKLARIRLCSGTWGGGNANELERADLKLLEALPQLREIRVGHEDETETALPVPFSDEDFA